MTFRELSFLAQSLLGLWALILCIADFVTIIAACAIKRYRYALLSLPAMILSFLLCQVNYYLHIYGSTTVVFGWLISLPWLLWLLALLVISTVPVLSIYNIYHYIRTSVSPLSIKGCADTLSCGICFWRDNGHVIFSNDCMNRLCRKLTSAPLMNGVSLRRSIPEDIVNIDGRYWRFGYRSLQFEGATLHELIAWDVTEIYSKTRELQKDNEELSELNRRLSEYSLKIDDVVRDREILQAKVNIHDEMNRLLLYTSAADVNAGEKLDKIYNKWMQNTLLLCMEAESGSTESMDGGLEKLSALLGIKMEYHGQLPASLTGQQKSLFYSVAHEAVTNAVKHAHADKLDIFFTESEAEIVCCFENAGDIPGGEASFTGGLANLEYMAREQGACLRAENDETFRLLLHFTKNA